MTIQNRQLTHALFYRAVNIYFLIGASFLVTLIWKISPDSSVIKNFMESWFPLSLNYVKELKLSSILLHTFFHKNVLNVLLISSILLMLVSKLLHFYSSFVLGKLFIYFTLSSGIAHLILAPGSQLIYGSFPVLLGFWVLFCRFYGKNPIFTILKRHLNLNILTFVFILINFFIAGRDFYPFASSLASHLGVLLFLAVFISRDKNRYYKNKSPSSKKRKSYVKFSEIYSNKKPVFNHKQAMNKKEAVIPIPSEKEINRILDKISKNGIHSITEKERLALRMASKKR